MPPDRAHGKRPDSGNLTICCDRHGTPDVTALLSEKIVSYAEAGRITHLTVPLLLLLHLPQGCNLDVEEIGLLLEEEYSLTLWFPYIMVRDS